jgi:GT2 family glycosyltransferase
MGVVSVLICTRNRPASLLRTVRSLLATEVADYEVIVIDQSDRSELAPTLSDIVRDPRLHYVPVRSRGKGAALNEGFRRARGEIVVLTDDDCEAAPGWAVAMTRMLESQPTAAIAFCNVTAASHDVTAGYIPAFERRQDRLLESIAACRDGLGLGAGMALRRGAVMALGGFDERFGPGAQFASGDDWDICYRVLLSGWHVFETAQLSIVHHGFRTFAEGREHTRRDWISAGAHTAKLLRAVRFRAATIPLRIFFYEALWPPILDLLKFRRPRKLSRVLGFVKGFVEGIRMPVDRKTLLFR